MVSHLALYSFLSLPSLPTWWIIAWASWRLHTITSVQLSLTFLGPHIHVNTSISHFLLPVIIIEIYWDKMEWLWVQRLLTKSTLLFMPHLRKLLHICVSPLSLWDRCLAAAWNGAMVYKIQWYQAESKLPVFAFVVWDDKWKIVTVNSNYASDIKVIVCAVEEAKHFKLLHQTEVWRLLLWAIKISALFLMWFSSHLLTRIMYDKLHQL